jgi:hypothetical protein
MIYLSTKSKVKPKTIPKAEREAYAALHGYRIRISQLTGEDLAHLPNLSEAPYWLGHTRGLLHEEAHLPAAVSTDPTDTAPCLFWHARRDGRGPICGVTTASEVAKARMPANFEPPRELTAEELEANRQAKRSAVTGDRWHA